MVVEESEILMMIHVLVTMITMVEEEAEEEVSLISFFYVMITNV